MMIVSTAGKMMLCRRAGPVGHAAMSAATIRRVPIRPRVPGSETTSLPCRHAAAVRATMRNSRHRA